LGVCAYARDRLPAAGIAMLSASDVPEHKVKALEAGADDYLTPGMGLAEILARLGAIQRRSSFWECVAAAQRRIGPLVVDLLNCEARVDGARVLLPMAQWAILVTMVKQVGRAVSHDELRRVGDIQWHAKGANLRGIMQDLRTRLGAAGSLIQSERGVGYGIWPSHAASPLRAACA